MVQNNCVSLTKGGHQDLGHINKAFKLHIILTTIQIRMHISSLGSFHLSIMIHASSLALCSSIPSSTYQPSFSSISTPIFPMGKPLIGWRPQTNQPLALLPPSQPQPQLTHLNPPKKTQFMTKPNPNPKNKHTKKFYIRETYYLAYVVEIQEINFRYAKVLLENHPPSPPKELEEEKG